MVVIDADNLWTDLPVTTSNLSVWVPEYSLPVSYLILCQLGSVFNCCLGPCIDNYFPWTMAWYLEIVWMPVGMSVFPGFHPLPVAMFNTSSLPLSGVSRPYSTEYQMNDSVLYGPIAATKCYTMLIIFYLMRQEHGWHSPKKISINVVMLKFYKLGT